MICHKPAMIIVRARCMLKFKENPIIGLGVYEWSTFYEEHEMCIFVGVLAGSRYYDEDGNETELRRGIVEECSAAKKIADEERERKKAERMAARLARKKANANSK